MPQFWAAPPALPRSAAEGLQGLEIPALGGGQHLAGEVRVPDTLLKKGKDGKPLKDAQGHPVINPSKFRSVARKAIREGAQS